MASPGVLRDWAKMARSLDIEIIAPQHGAMFVGREKVKRFIDWVDGLPCGPETLGCNFRIP